MHERQNTEGKQEVANCTVVSGSVYLPLTLTAVGMAIIANWYPIFVAFVMPVMMAALMAGLSYSDRYEVVDCG